MPSSQAPKAAVRTAPIVMMTKSRDSMMRKRSIPAVSVVEAWYTNRRGR